MGTVNQFVNKAVSYLGANYKHFCDAFWGGCYAWCASFVAVVGKETGVDVPWSTSCTAQRNEWKKRGRWFTDKNIQVGDVVYYDWDKSGDCDHVGICTMICSDGRLRITEGNYGDYDSDCTKVTHRYIYRNYPYIAGYGRPVFETEKVEDKKEEKTNTTTTNTSSTSSKEKDVTVTLKQVQKGSTGVVVRRLQAMLKDAGYDIGKWGADGEYGNDTYRAVTEFQREKGLTADGIVGPLTWAALFK